MQHKEDMENLKMDGNFQAEKLNQKKHQKVIKLLDTVEYDYPNFHLSMDCFICHIKSGNLVLKEHEAAKWLTKDTLYSVDWLPADRGLIPMVEKYL